MKRLIVLVILLVAQASAQSQSIDSAQTDGLGIAPIAHRSAEAWGLSIDEWQRQTELRALSQGMLSKDLTPLEVLGILSDNPADRKRYARLYAERQVQFLKQIAAFEADYLEAVAELNSSTTATVRWRLVADAECRIGECADLIRQAIRHAQSGDFVDMFVLGAPDNQTIRSWATRHRIPPELVRQRTITLNHAAADMVPGLRTP